MKSEMEKQAINLLVEAMNDDSLIIFVGAGVSANSGLPGWNQLVDVFRDELALDDDADNLKVAQFYYDTWGQQKYFQKISDIFNEHLNAQPNEIHKHIFRIQPRHLITTNYDTILENKMNSEMDKYDVLKQDKDIPYSKSSRYLIKMHGDLLTKNIVLKENDYLDYENNFYMISTMIKSLIMNNTLLFIGYSLSDSTFNSIFRLIHNSLGDNAKRAFFYTPNAPKSPVVEYYKKKGIFVISDDEEIEQEGLGKSTSNFLVEISSRKNSLVTNEEELWEKIRFLDKLSFVESRDVASFSKLSSGAILYYPDKFEVTDKKNENLILTENSRAMKFLSQKTWINKFLNNEVNHSNDSISNEVLEPAFALYKDNKFSEARLKFREIANQSFERKDYFNFLISEFNVQHINSSAFEDNKKIAEAVYDEGLPEVLERIIDSSRQDNKKIALFFRDTIMNLKFVYRKLFKIDDLLDEIRRERFSYKNGGFSSNSNLSILNYEFNSFIKFINTNCICIHQYKEFHLIVKRYFESLLVALDNSNYESGSDNVFGKTASIIEAIELSSIENVLPYLNIDDLSTYLDSYNLSKIKVTDEAYQFIIGEISRLCDRIDNHTQSECGLLKKYINFLFSVEIKDSVLLINILEKCPIFFNNRDETRKILIMLINNSKDFTKSDYRKISDISMKQLEVIFNNETESHYTNYPYYDKLLGLATKSIGEIKLSFPKLNDQLLIIANVENKIIEIGKHKDFLSSFYKYLDVEEKELVDKILDKYSNLPKSKVNLEFVIEMINSDIKIFDNMKKTVFSMLTDIINQTKDDGIQFSPDPSKMAISYLFDLVQHGYFDIDDISNAQIDNKLKGQFPEVDWILFNIRDKITLEKLLEHRTFYQAKEAFGKCDGDKQLFDDWVINQLNQDNYELKKKK